MTELRIAVVGAGPAGLYVADGLVFQPAVPVRVDVFDRLPTPFGLLRYGVAPDHLKMKSLATTLQRTIDDELVRFIGGVEIGSHLSVRELRDGYHGVVYAFGAATDHRLAVPGEDLPGSRSAISFVTWYSGHPDVAADDVDLSVVRSVAVVGAGNVAVDVARMLCKSVDELRATDVPEPVLQRLATSAVTDVHILCRRGPAQAKFTYKELRELGELAGVDIVVDPGELLLSELEQLHLRTHPALRKNVDLLAEWSQRPLTGARRRLHLHFWTRPVAVSGGLRVERLVVESTRIEDGRLIASGAPRELPAQLVLRSVGYRGVCLPGVPLDHQTGTIPAADGRVLRDGRVSRGEYVAGWIGRGPIGVLGTNRADAEGIVERMLEDSPALLGRALGADPVALLAQRGVEVVDAHGWGRIDRAERERGAAQGRARTKIATWQELYQASRPTALHAASKTDAGTAAMTAYRHE